MKPYVTQLSTTIDICTCIRADTSSITLLMQCELHIQMHHIYTVTDVDYTYKESAGIVRNTRVDEASQGLPQ